MNPLDPIDGELTLEVIRNSAAREIGDERRDIQNRESMSFGLFFNGPAGGDEDRR